MATKVPRKAAKSQAKAARKQADALWAALGRDAARRRTDLTGPVACNVCQAKGQRNAFVEDVQNRGFRCRTHARAYGFAWRVVYDTDELTKETRNVTKTAWGRILDGAGNLSIRVFLTEPKAARSKPKASPTEPKPPVIISNEGELPYHCALHRRSFATRTELNEHYRIDHYGT